ncbi:MAG: PGF-pre-PGF domain-containing protein [Candidatus Woesearchaeota archaeon]|nr:PGF-pre-PGF domain-containing protein [Candidatus Woesearchaeota archaeon]
MKMKKTTLSLTIMLAISFILSSFLVSAVPAVWCGYADIGGTYSSTGTVIEAFVNSGATAAGTTRVGDYGITETGYYQIYVDGHDGDNVTFKIYGVAANASVQTWHLGFNCPPYLNISINKTATGGSCSYSAACSGGYCCSGATEYTSGSGTGTCQASACSAGEGGTSGGGVEVTGGGAVAAGITETQTVASVSAGSAASFKFTKLDSIGITEIDVNVNANKKDIKLIVSETSKPALATIAISSKDGGIFKYIKITKVGLLDSEITNVKIKFKIPKSWLLTNNIDPSTITLKHLITLTWEDLSTTQISSDSNYYYFEATSLSLSTFAIVGRKMAAVTPTPVPTPAPQETPAPEETPAVIEEESVKKPVSSLLIFVLIIAIIALLVVMVYLTLTKKKKSF